MQDFFVLVYIVIELLGESEAAYQADMDKRSKVFCHTILYYMKHDKIKSTN